jgi:hypothetical protein
MLAAALGGEVLMALAALVRDVLQGCAGSYLEELSCELKGGRRAVEIGAKSRRVS